MLMRPHSERRALPGFSALLSSSFSKQWNVTSSPSLSFLPQKSLYAPPAPASPPPWVAQALVNLDAAVECPKGECVTDSVLFFKGSNYMRLDTHRDGLHAFPITRSWKELTNGVDAVFSYNDRIYLIKGDQVYIYKAGAHFTLIDGYPKTLKEELNIDGQVDAAFVCPGQRTAHIIQGRKIIYIDLTATPREITLDAPLPFADIDAAFCSSDGIKVFQGSNYYHYDSPMLLVMSRIAPIPLKVTSAMVGCED